MALNTGYLTARTNKESDELFTPYYAVDPIIKYIPKNKIIWMPFDQEYSAFYQLFKKLGYTVIRSHLEDGKDFFTYEPDNYDVIVSNPPFSIKDNILGRFFAVFPLG